jgi:hypothetical protein
MTLRALLQVLQRTCSCKGGICHCEVYPISANGQPMDPSAPYILRNASGMPPYFADELQQYWQRNSLTSQLGMDRASPPCYAITML